MGFKYMEFVVCHFSILTPKKSSFSHMKSSHHSTDIQLAFHIIFQLNIGLLSHIQKFSFKK